MPEQLVAQPGLRTRHPRWGILLLVALLAFLLGGGAVGWLAWHEKLSLADITGLPSFAGPPAQTASPGVQDAAPAAPAPSAALADGAIATRVAALEQRLDQLDIQASSEEGNTARAEALLVAFAARRATERGAPLGYLEDQLKLRFGDALPNAVATVLAAERDPITVDLLSARLQAMAPTLTTAPRDTGTWQQLRSELSNLFVLRHGAGPTPPPASRLDHALLCLREGRINDAIADVQRLPDATDAAGWIGSAHRYAQVEQALDLLETTALLEPRELRDGAGRPVNQPSPLAEPAALPGPSPVNRAAANPSAPSPATPPVASGNAATTGQH